MLKPLELRQHKFDCFTDDCIYLGTVRDGRGIRFLRLSNRKVYVRNDMVVTQGVMPYRSVGGFKTALQVKSIDAADLDIMFNVRWDEHEDGNVNNNTVANTEAGRDTAQQGLRNKTVDNTPLPLLLQGRDTTATDQGSTEHAQANTPVSTAHTPAVMSSGGASSVMPQGWVPSPGGETTPRNLSYSPFKPKVSSSQDHKSGPGSPVYSHLLKKMVGVWPDNHCREAGCEFPRGHTGVCSNQIEPDMQQRMSRSAHAAKAQLPAVTEENNITEGTPEEERQIDALLGSATTVEEAQWLPTPVVLGTNTVVEGNDAIAFQSCVDAYSAIARAEDILQPSNLNTDTTRAISKKRSNTANNRRAVGLPEFDVALPIPNDIAEAMAQHDNWNAEFGHKYAVDRECGTWIKMEVLKAMVSGEKIPDDVHALNLRTMFTVKKTKKGKFLRSKLRIIALGHQYAAKRGEHYFENFSQTVKWGSLRTACAMACEEGFEVACQWDTNAAFLYAGLEPGARALVKLSPELQKIWGMSEYCWCMKAVYGLPSAPRAWFKHVTAFLVGKCHMRILKQDEAIAILRDKHGKYLRICMYVDDFAVFSNSRELYNECRDAYFGQDGFEGEEGPLDYMLGVNFDVDFEKQSIKLSGTSSINKVLERYGKPQRGSKVPMLESDADLQYAELPAEGSAEQLALRERAARYLSLVPSILYFATTCRPDICFAVGILCRCLSNPSLRHLEAAETLLAYLMDTSEVGIQYKHSGDTRGLSVMYSTLKEGLYALSDSDWSSGKSISGYVIMLACGAIIWGSKKQPVTSLSSTEAEYYAASACGVEVMATRHLVADDLGMQLTSTPIYVDNSACVSLAKDFNSCKRAKHINRRVNFLNDYTQSQDIEVISISTHENTSDVFTKPLGKIKFLKFRAALGM